MINDSANIIELFKENELNVSELYGLYAQKIPAHHDFWSKLAKQEIEHAQDVESTYSGSEESFVENNFSKGVIKHIIDSVKNEIQKAKKNNVSHLEALTAALKIEKSILEKKCFEIFAPTSMTVKKMLKKLNQETEGHVKLIEKELGKLKTQYRTS